MAAAALVLTAGGVTGAWWLMTADDRADEEHYRRAETSVAIANLSGHPVQLYRAGTHLAGTTPFPFSEGPELWLRPGNYFLRVDGEQTGFFLPIPLTGYRSGPDKGGSFVVTVRPLPNRSPLPPSGSITPFSYIPSGNFLMGDRQNPREPHHVWLSAYFIAPFEVTNGEIRRFFSAPDGYAEDRYWTDEGKKWKGENNSRCSAVLGPGDPDYARFGQDDLPVTGVNWFEANAFCSWLTGTLGSGRWQYALPSDAEWEKAARGPDNFDYALGMTISDAEVPLYNWKKNPDAPVTVVGVRSTPGQYNPNRYGLFHMTGNVAEWTQSVNRPFNREHPYADDERNQDATAGQRTVRGGSWYSASIAYLYIPYRDAFPPSHCTQDIGFRLVARLLP